MLRRTLHKAVVAALLSVCAAFSAHGQASGTYTPYSIYGVGDLSQPGTARDSLSFMTDFSVYGDNKLFNQEKIKSVSNTFNINDLVMSFPLWHHTAMMVGIMPYSDTGFGYSFDYTDPDLIGHTGNITYSAAGSGSI